ncbi:hypothetical protein JOQ06_027457 [Pogonophryne albipinna]|uniref:Uncharacterized protein n=1 Tax=Pogonophryne albipinna TaxID=1090488 RepID=A0AAD6FQ34_9TELE|nr:hypothetical protein JOQ06_027457 [Pogonophryne albipinna]
MYNERHEKERQPVAERRQVDSAGKVSLKTAGWCRVTPSYCLQDHESQTKSNSAANPHERNMAAVRPYGTFVWFRSSSPNPLTFRAGDKPSLIDVNSPEQF